jgi:hypothetical protein
MAVNVFIPCKAAEQVGLLEIDFLASHSPVFGEEEEQQEQEQEQEQGTMERCLKHVSSSLIATIAYMRRSNH